MATAGALGIDDLSLRDRNQLARSAGVRLDDGRVYRRGVLISEGDASSAAQTRMRDAGLDAQVRGQAIQGIAPQQGISAFDNRAVGRLGLIDAGGRIPFSRIPVRYGGTAGGQFGGEVASSEQRVASSRTGQPGFGALVAQGLDALRRNRGTVMGRNYSEDALMQASPEQILTEAGRLQPLLQAQRALMDVNRAGLLPGRHYNASTLGAASPEQTLAEAAGLGDRLSFEAQGRTRTQEAARRAAFGTAEGVRSQESGASREFNSTLEPLDFDAVVPADARNVTGSALGLPGDEVERAVQSAGARYLAAGGDPLNLQAVQQAARMQADPTGEITFQRQLARDQQRAELDAVRQERAISSRETAAERRDVSARLGVVSREAAKAEASLWQPLEDEGTATQAALNAIGYSGRIFTSGDAKADLASPDQALKVMADRGDAEGQQRFAQAYLQARQHIINQRLAQNPEVAATLRERDFLRARAAQLGLGAGGAEVAGSEQRVASRPEVGAPDSTPEGLQKQAAALRKDAQDFAASLKKPEGEAAPKRNYGGALGVLDYYRRATPEALAAVRDAGSSLGSRVNLMLTDALEPVANGLGYIVGGNERINDLDMMRTAGRRRSIENINRLAPSTGAETIDPATADRNVFGLMFEQAGDALRTEPNTDFSPQGRQRYDIRQQQRMLPRLPYAERVALAQRLGLPYDASLVQIDDAARAYLRR